MELSSHQVFESANYSRRTFMAGTVAACTPAVFGPLKPAAAGTVPVRSDIMELAKNKAGLAKFEAAVQEMQDRSARNPDDPSGWLVNAKAHADFCSVPAPTQEPQIHFCWWFLPWHRAYLSVTERKLREIAKDDTLTLPYWNWSTDRHIPAPYSRAGSPLAKAKRYTPPRAVQDGEVDYFPNDPVRKKLGVAALGASFFQAKTASQIGNSFGGIARPNPSNNYNNNRLEGTPHGPIHNYTGGVGPQGQGGDMSNFETAGRDPVFFAHHGNLDRLWEIWRQVPEHRKSEPQSAAFLDHEFSFTWLDGSPVMVKAADVLDTKNLGYVYDTLTVFRPSAPQLFAAQEVSARLPPMARQNVTAPFSAEAAGENFRKILEITDIEPPQRLMTVGVYLKAASAPPDESGEYVGTFSAIRAGSTIAWPSSTLSFDVTQAVNVNPAPELTVELIPFRIQSSGEETYPPLHYGSMRITSEAQ